jgi:hypothetical protein
LPLFRTTDTTGTDSLFILEIDGRQSGHLAVFQPTIPGSAARWTVTGASRPLPEPASPLLFAKAILAAILIRHRANSGTERRSLAFTSFGRWLSLGVAALVCASAQAAFHVTPSGGQTPHDGTQWMTAFSAADLQSAIDNNPGGEFWLARGGYGAIQSLPDGTQLYGGFLGVLESSRDQRDPDLNTTILDTVEITPYFDSGGNEIIQGPNTVVDGFLIVGFGVHIEKGTPVISHNVIRGARGIEVRNGAGPTSDCDIESVDIGVSIFGPRRQVRQPNGQPAEVQPLIVRSSIKGVNGGILQNFDAAKIKVSSTHISDMTSGFPLLLQGEAEFKDCFIENNRGGFSAALHIEGQRTALNSSFDNCAIRNNTGTGVIAHPMANSNVVLSNSEISGNISTGFAGGIWIDGEGVQVINSKIIGNQSARNGGGIYSTNFVSFSRNQIVNTLIAGNKAIGNGGGLAVSMERLAVLNSTIVDNSASIGGGAWLESTTAFPRLRDIAGLHGLNPRPLHPFPGGRKRALRVDSATCIVDHYRGESQVARVERGPCDAEIRRKPTDVDAVDAALPQIAAKPGRGFSIRLDEGGVAVDVQVVTLAQNQLGMRDVEIPAKVCTLGALDTVVGPQYLLAIVERDLVEGFLARVRGRERTMSRRMPILGEHDIGKALGQVVDDRHDFVPSRNGEAATREE